MDILALAPPLAFFAVACGWSSSAGLVNGTSDTRVVVDAGGSIEPRGVAEAGVAERNPADAGGSVGAQAMGPIIGTPLATFDSDLNGFALNRFVEATNLALASPPATATWIATDGSPDPGCVKITAAYSGPNQWVDLEAQTLPTPMDWSGRKLHVRVKLEPSSAFSGTARLYVKTGTAYSFYPNIDAYPQSAGWQEFVLALVSPAPVPPAIAGADPAQVLTFGIDPESTSVSPTAPTVVTFYVDSFSLE